VPEFSAEETDEARGTWDALATSRVSSKLKVLLVLATKRPTNFEVTEPFDVEFEN
jgi:hypothetical protein